MSTAPRRATIRVKGVRINTLLPPAEVVVPDQPINEATPLRWGVPLQTVFLSVRSCEIRDSGLP